MTTVQPPPAHHLRRREELVESFAVVRERSLQLAAPLQPEDTVVQTMPDVSPVKWHLGHTTWFFETFVLAEALDPFEPFDARFARLFNSYYNAVGPQHPRPERGHLSRPTLAHVHDYRGHVDRAMARFLEDATQGQLERFADVVEVGLHHEEQHQELLLMDAKHVLATNPLRPAYRTDLARRRGSAPELGWSPFSGGTVAIGHDGQGFCFDNERPRHEVLLAPYELADRLVTCGEYLEFMESGGYANPELWLADGWGTRLQEGWEAPLYWWREEGAWRVSTLSGPHEVDAAEPVCHLSYYEADAYARWAGCRLPTEQEWENAVRGAAIEGNFLENDALQPLPATNELSGRPAQLFGDLWEWTASPYTPYPGYRPFAGRLGEYNGKFMVNQLVLRGGSCVTPRGHVRPTYRNFFYPHQRWAFAGLRLAR